MALYNTVPTVPDAFARFMIEAFDDRKIIGVSTGFFSLFANPANGGKTLFSTDANVIDIDIVRGNKKIGKMTKRGVPGKAIDQSDSTGGKFTTQTMTYPIIKEQMPIEPDQSLARQPGENPYIQRTRIERNRIIAMNNMTEGARRIIRTAELQASNSIILGKMFAVDPSVPSPVYEYDFQRNPDNSFDAVTDWTDAGANIIGDLRKACDFVRKNGKVMPDALIVSDIGMQGIENNTAIKELADNRRFELVQINTMVPPQYQAMVDNGFIPRGRIVIGGFELWIFVYLDSYTDDADNDVPYMPVDKAVVFSTKARCDRYFGPSEMRTLTPMEQDWHAQLFGISPASMVIPEISEAPKEIIPGEMFYFYVSGIFGQPIITCHIECAPIFATTHTDAFSTITYPYTP